MGVDGEIPDREIREWDVRTLDGRPYRPDELPLARSLRTGEVVTNERLTLVAMDGSTVFVDVSSAPVLDSTGQSIGALSLFHDVPSKSGWSGPRASS